MPGKKAVFWKENSLEVFTISPHELHQKLIRGFWLHRKSIQYYSSILILAMICSHSPFSFFRKPDVTEH